MCNTYPYPVNATGPIRPTALVNAPDGKIYVSHMYKGFLGAINSPNSAGLACNYVDSVISHLPGATNAWGGLPNFFEDYINPRSLKSNFSFNQVNNTVTFINSSNNAIGYVWKFGDNSMSTLTNPVHVYADTGYFNVTLSAKDTLCNVDRICYTIHISSIINGINENMGHFDFNVYPNPFNNNITVELSGTGNFELELYDRIGQKIKTLSVTEKQKITWQPGEDLSSGIYFLRIKNKKFALTKKLMKH